MDDAATVGVRGLDSECERSVRGVDVSNVVSDGEQRGDDKCPFSPKGELKYSWRVDPTMGC